MWSPREAVLRREAKRRSTYYARLDVTPIAAVLLSLYMVVAPVGPQLDLPSRAGVDQASARNAVPQPDARREDAMIIAVTRDGNIFFQDHSVILTEIPAEIRSAVRAGSKRNVFVNADARAKYGDVEQVVEQIQSAGVTDVIFMVEKYPPEK